MDVDEYILEAGRRQRRLRWTVLSIVAALLVALFAPWVLVKGRVLSSDTATGMSAIAVVLLIGGWQALLIKVGSPNDAPEATEQSRKTHLRSLLMVAAAILAALVAAGVASFLVGAIERGGLLMTILLAVLMAMMVVRTLVRRAMGW
jgi:hypothetical protein